VTLLLDTCTILWWVSDNPRLGEARSVIANTEHVHVSVVSLFEITIKIGIGKLTIDLAALTDALRADGFQTMPIKEHHLLAQLTLPLLHRDPFDRLLIAQAMTENLAIVSDDRHLAAYPIGMIRCG
jgi:PIN domain nuclease of toxin-antitoxin system